MTARVLFARRIAALPLLLAFVAMGVPARSAGEPVEINVVVPLTGPIAIIGSSAAKALGFLEADVNAHGGVAGRPIKFVVSDTQSNPAVTLQVVNRIIATKAPVIIGPNLAAECGAIASVLKDGPVEFCLSPGVHPEPGSFVFSAAPSTVDLALTTLHYAKRRGLKKMAFLFTTDQSGIDGEKVITQVFTGPEAGGVRIVDIEHFGVSDLSVTAQLARIKAANPDALYVWTSGPASGTAFRAIQDTGLNLPILTSYSNASGTQLSAFKDLLPKELLIPGLPAMFPASQLPKGALQDAVAAFDRIIEAGGGKPDVLQTTAWDSALLTVAALRKLGPNPTAAQLREYLASLKSFTGVTGSFDFQAIPQRGVDWKSAVIMGRWDAAKGIFERVSPIGG